MNFVELQIPAKALLEVFEAKSVATGMTQAVPGGGTLAVGGLDKRATSLTTSELFPFPDGMPRRDTDRKSVV